MFLCLIISIFSLESVFPGNGNDDKTKKIPILYKNKEYPEKSLKLEKEVTYIPLETTNDILLDKDAHIYYVSDTQMLISNKNKGDVFFFNMSGKATSHFNRKGGNGYWSIKSIAYDEKSKEVYVLDTPSAKRIFVYTEKGELKRSLQLPRNTYFIKIYDFDENSLLALHENMNNIVSQSQPYMFISKEDGSVLSKVNISIDKVNSTVSYDANKSVWSMWTSRGPDNCKFGQEYILANMSSDTIYMLKQDKTLTPVFVQYPSVFSEPKRSVKVGMKTDNFIFFVVSSMYSSSTNSQHLIYDFKSGEFFKYDSRISIGVQDVDISKNTGVTLIEAVDLKEGLEKGVLKGELKKIASKIDIEDNPVVELEKFK